MSQGPATRRAPTAPSASRPAARLRATRLLWVALCLSNPLFFVVVFAVGPQGELQASLVPIAALLALGAAVASFVFPASWLARALRRLPVRLVDVPGEATSGFREPAPVERRIANPEQTLVDGFVRYTTSLVLGMALAESVGLWGVIFAFLGAPPWMWAPFAVVSLGIMLSKFPRISTVARALERATGAKLEL